MTHLGLPVWQAAFEVRLYGDPIRLASSNSTLHRDVELERPRTAALESFTGDDPGTLAGSAAG